MRGVRKYGMVRYTDTWNGVFEAQNSIKNYQSWVRTVKLSEIKEKIEWIDRYECHPGEVADCLQLLVEWLSEFIEYSELASDIVENPNKKEE